MVIGLRDTHGWASTSILTLFYTPLKKTFNTFKRFYAALPKIFTILFKGLETTLSNTQYSLDPWKISTPPKGSIKTLTPFHLVFPPFFFFQTVSHPRVLYRPPQ
jgi:hypothetical protein